MKRVFLILTAVFLLIAVCGVSAQTEPGDIVLFGRYEQDFDVTDGPEPVEWLVLAAEGDRVLLVSRYGLDLKRFNEERTDVSWETSTLREWLNGPFFDIAFSDAEKKMIAEPGEAIGRVFLLSADEAEKYFRTDAERMCRVTKLVKASGVYVNKENGNSFWWLRSSGSSGELAAEVSVDGSINTDGRYVDTLVIAVRPAIWLTLPVP